MHKFHIIVSVVNIIAGALAAIGFLFDFTIPLVVGMALGVYANLFAILVSIIVLVMFLVKIPLKKHKEFLASSWLGLLNGISVVVFWVFFLKLSAI